ncbi:MAG: potassium/proton antiporter, partial [Solirubrobacterales bacterium]|nr:potassium/proton antiporter [Solirubrobacterales bacterium]
MTDGELLLICGALLACGIAAAVLANRIRVPGLLLFLGLGMLLGSDGLSLISFSDYELTQRIGIIALVLILFEGGLAAGWPEIRPVLRPALALATVGTALTAVIGGLIAAWLFDISILEGMLLGSIVSCTDGAAIFSLLRGSTLRRRLARSLEGEAGFNDPVAVLLVIGFVDWLQKPDYGIADMLISMAQEMAIGAVVGIIVGRVAVFALGRVRLSSAGLYPVASIAICTLAFGTADVIHGSGFLAVYLAGLAIGSTDLPAKRTIVTFHEGLAWVAQLAMFFTLGLLVFPSQFGDVVVEGTVLAIAAVVVARPLSVFVATVFEGFEVREQLVLGWAGLRGAVPVVLATFPVLAGVPDSERFFNIVFFAVLVSTVLQGTTFEAFARRLGVTTNVQALPTPLTNQRAMQRLGAEVVEFEVGTADAADGVRVRDLGLPRDALLNVIVRGEQAIPPRGSTLIEAGDRLHVLVRQEVAIEFNALLERWRHGPIGPAPRPPREWRSVPSVSTTRPFDAERDDNPGAPTQVNGIPVLDRLRTRRDGVAGALVELEDGRFAVTGPVVMVGGSNALARDAQRRLTYATGDTEVAWWREVIGAVAANGSAPGRSPRTDAVRQLPPPPASSPIATAPADAP